MAYMGSGGVPWPMAGRVGSHLAYGVGWGPMGSGGDTSAGVSEPDSSLSALLKISSTRSARALPTREGGAEHAGPVRERSALVRGYE